MNIEALADKIVKAFPELELNRSEILQKLKLLVYEFRVPEDEAVRTIKTWIAREHRKIKPEAPLIKIGELSEEYAWVTIEAKVVKVWNPNNESIAQAGLIGDETGIIRFVTWTKAEKPLVEEGKCYRFENVVVHKWKDQLQINVTRTSEIVEVDRDIQVKKNTIRFVAVLTKILSNSGLIKRCSECRRVIRDLCPVHGKVQGIDDLRLKAVFDDGKNTYDVILNEDAIKSLTGIDLQKAIEIAKEQLDRNAVLRLLREKVLCKYYEVEGVNVGRFVLVKSIRRC